MTNRLLLCLLTVLLFVTCKKDKKPVVYNYDLTGNWLLSSYQTNFGAGVDATATQYPCMNYNILTLYNDSTSSQTYIGLDTCFITPSHLAANGAQVFGSPGQGTIKSTWSMKGNAIHITFPGDQTIAGVISTVNNRLQITLKDTVTSGANTYFITSVEVKQ